MYNYKTLTGELTPVQMHGGVHVKRDDLFEVAGVNGGKARTCYYLATREPRPKGLITSGARGSPQANIVASIARYLGVPCRVHMPSGELSEQGLLAQQAGAEIIQHKPGYNSVIVKRARDDALALGWREIPFGMECQEAVVQTSHETRSISELNLQKYIKRIVVTVGSGMSLAGILHGLQHIVGVELPVLGVVVGADPYKRLNSFAPFGWYHQVTIERSPLPYRDNAKECQLGDLMLDEVYEAKCLPYLQHTDLFWVVGSRNRLERGT